MGEPAANNGIYATLMDAGFSKEKAHQIVDLLEKEKLAEACEIFTLQRRKLLSQVHKEQKRLDILDYFVYQLKKKKKGDCNHDL